VNETHDRAFTGLLSFVIAVGPVSVDMYLPAFSQIAQDFHDPAAPQLSLAWYQIGFAIGQITFGPLSDARGRRPALGVGLTLYMLASVGCALAPGTISLCVCRAIAAFGAAASIVVVRAIVFDLAAGDAAAQMLSTVFAWMTVAPLLAPVLGNLVLLGAGWRAIFVVAAIYGVICGLLVLRVLPETLPPARRLPFGPLDFAARGAAILRERGFLTHAAIGSCAMFALFAYLGGSATLFETDYGLGSTVYSWILAGVGAATIGLLRLSRRLVGRPGWGTFRVIDVYLKLFLVGSLVLIPLVWLRVPWPLVLLGLLPCVACFTCVQPNVQPGAIRLHQAHRGTAQALMSTLQYGSGALASALLAWLADGTGRPMAVLFLLSAAAALLAARLRPGAG
jgi:DHA1 family bicyclomycin/chloramphenicol resistance-like MFS transporter